MTQAVELVVGRRKGKKPLMPGLEHIENSGRGEYGDQTRRAGLPQGGVREQWCKPDDPAPANQRVEDRERVDGNRGWLDLQGESVKRGSCYWGVRRRGPTRASWLPSVEPAAGVMGAGSTKAVRTRILGPPARAVRRRSSTLATTCKSYDLQAGDKLGDMHA